MTRDTVAQSGEQIREETVALVTEPSAPPKDDLLVDAFGIDRDLAAKVDVEVRYRSEADRKEFESDLGFDTFQLLRTRVGVTAVMGSSSKAKAPLWVEEAHALSTTTPGRTPWR